MLFGSGLVVLSFPAVLALIVRKIMGHLSRSASFSLLDRLQFQWATRNAPEVSRAGSVVGVMLMAGVFISGLYIVSNGSPWADNFALTKNRVAQVVVNCQLRPECFDELNTRLKNAAPGAFVGATFIDEEAEGQLGAYRVEAGLTLHP